MFSIVIRPSGLREKLTPLAILLLLGACGGGGGGGGIPNVSSEDETTPNDTLAAANTLTIETPIRGDVSTAGDVDCFAIQLSAGRTVRFELFGTRLDQGNWDANGNVPRLTILDTDANSNAKLLEQDYSGNFSDGWGWGTHDLDIPMFHVPATGTYFVQVTQDNQSSDGGAYILRASYVSVSGPQQEAEAAGVSGDNDTFATAELIRPGTMHGFHVAGELDYYKFTISGPTVVRFEMNAYRNGVHNDSGLYYDTWVELMDTDGTTELTSDDDSYFYDSAIQYELTTAGTYYFVVDEYDPADGEYFLTYTASSAGGALESEPNDDAAHADSIAYGGRVRGVNSLGESDYYKFSGQAGDMVRLQYFDSDNAQSKPDDVSVSLIGTDGATALQWGGDEDFQTLTTILQETGTFYIKVENGGVDSPYALELTRFASSTYETEPNDTDVEAGVLSTRVSGVIDSAPDVDMYRVTLTKDRLARFSCYASSAATSSDGVEDLSGHGSDLAPMIELLDGTGTVVATSTSIPNLGIYAESVTDPLPTTTLATVVDTTGTYFVRISAADGASGATHYYVLEYQSH